MKTAESTHEKFMFAHEVVKVPFRLNDMSLGRAVQLKLELFGSWQRPDGIGAMINSATGKGRQHELL
jgi:hypothetical protein